jgi:hypothetical protein
MAEMATLFERLSGAQPPPARARKKDHEKRPPEEVLLVPAQKLLDWLLQGWTKDTITPRDIGIWGPNSIRNRKDAIRAAEVLVHHGWLRPKKMRRYNARVWEIARKPVVQSIVATD